MNLLRKLSRKKVPNLNTSLVETFTGQLVKGEDERQFCGKLEAYLKSELSIGYFTFPGPYLLEYSFDYNWETIDKTRESQRGFQLDFRHGFCINYSSTPKYIVFNNKDLEGIPKKNFSLSKDLDLYSNNSIF